MSSDSTGVSIGETFEEVLTRRVDRRGFLKGAASLAPLLAVAPPLLSAGAAEAAVTDGLGFVPVRLDGGAEIVVAPGYSVQKFLRWGEPIVSGAPAFDFFNQSAAAQSLQFG